MNQKGRETTRLKCMFMLNIEILDCFSHCTLVIQKTIILKKRK